MDYKTRTFLKKMLDSDIRTHLEELIGYDQVAAARDAVNRDVIDDRIIPLAEFLLKVVKEMESRG